MQRGNKATTNGPGYAVADTLRTRAITAPPDFSFNVDFIGAARGIRTPDPVITNDVLYRLSYCGLANVLRHFCALCSTT